MAQIPRTAHSKLSWDVDRGNYFKGWPNELMVYSGEQAERMI
jgi:hypothetical protein